MNILGIIDNNIFFNEITDGVIRWYYCYAKNHWNPDGRTAEDYYTQFTTTPGLNAVYTTAATPEEAKLEFPEFFI